MGQIETVGGSIPLIYPITIHPTLMNNKVGNAMLSTSRTRYLIIKSKHCNNDHKTEDRKNVIMFPDVKYKDIP